MIPLQHKEKLQPEKISMNEEYVLFITPKKLELQSLPGLLYTTWQYPAKIVKIFYFAAHTLPGTQFSKWCYMLKDKVVFLKP
jgi:hypothetical protein